MADEKEKSMNKILQETGKLNESLMLCLTFS